MVLKNEQQGLTSTATMPPPSETLELSQFWELSPEHREHALANATCETHTWHYKHNTAYRHTMQARGVGESITPDEFPRLLRPTAQTFKSYIDLMGTPFPQDQPLDFLEWIADQLSIALPRERFSLFRRRYASLEALLSDFERIFADYGFEILTSSGTSGRSTIMVRDQHGIDKTVESFYLAFQRYLGMRAEHRAVFIMPEHTRIAMARMAGFSIRRVGLPANRVHFTIPFSALPDQIRIRTGRTFRQGVKGFIERRILNPFMNQANDSYVMPKAIQQACDILLDAEAQGDKILLFGGWIQIHQVALNLREAGKILHLAKGSLLGTGGGFKEQYPFSAQQIRQDVSQVLLTADELPAPFRDVYGMAEANWAAMQCHVGNYHIPPWVYAVALDEDDNFIEAPEATGLLAFFDPFGGGRLFPAFFKTADQVRLINSGTQWKSDLSCPCGESGSYIPENSIQRVDLLEEAGCAAQI